jgi:hypothetical protein
LFIVFFFFFCSASKSKPSHRSTATTVRTNSHRSDSDLHTGNLISPNLSAHSSPHSSARSIHSQYSNTSDIEVDDLDDENDENDDAHHHTYNNHVHSGGKNQSTATGPTTSNSRYNHASNVDSSAPSSRPLSAQSNISV